MGLLVETKFELRAVVKKLFIICLLKRITVLFHSTKIHI